MTTAQVRSRLLPRLDGPISMRRKIAGFVIAVLGGPLLTLLLVQLRGTEWVTVSVLLYMLLVVIAAVVGGVWPAVFAAVLSGLSLDLFLLAPYNTLHIAQPGHALALVLYVVIAIIVSVVVDQAARRERTAQRAQAESELLTTVAGSVLRGESAAQALVARTREAFGATGVRLLDPEGNVIARDGEPARGGEPVQIPVGHRGTLELHGAATHDTERRVLDTVVTQVDATLEREELAAAAAAANERAAADEVRSALLSAVSHDVRRPLSAAVAAVGGLKSSGARLSADDRAELVHTADDSLGALSRLLNDLLDVSRVQAGALAIRATAVDAEEVIAASIHELGLTGEQVTVDASIPPLYADPALLRRVIVNVLANADRFSPAGSAVQVTAHVEGNRGEILVIDHGPGISADRQAEMFEPFQRMGDTDNSTGLGLGLALSKGFTEGMGGTLRATTTPGGGLTIVIDLPLAEATS